MKILGSRDGKKRSSRHSWVILKTASISSCQSLHNMKLIHSFSSLWGIFLHLLLLDTTTLVYSHPHNFFHHRAKANDSFGDLDGLELPYLKSVPSPI
jgi:ribosomal protein L32